MSNKNENPQFFETIIASTPKELGEAAKAFRKRLGRSINQVAEANAFGSRFLSEFERGKSTSQLGKVIEALNASGLDLAVVPMKNKLPSIGTSSSRVNNEGLTVNLKPVRNHSSRPENFRALNPLRPRAIRRHHSAKAEIQVLSQRLNLEFPYDWSNPNMDESTFISLVLEKARFTDVLKIAHHFGLERVQSLTSDFENLPQQSILNKYFNRIKIGISNAKSKKAMSAPA